MMNQPDSFAAPTPATAAAAVAPASRVPDAHPDRVPGLAWLIAVVFVAVELAFSDRYGFLQDELYFLVAGHHLAFGYVDQPPLTPLLTRITGLLGVSPTAIRIIPALAGGAVVVMTARLAALFGAGRLGRVLAALVTACAPVVIGGTHTSTTTAADLLAWTVVLLCVTTALLRDRPRWWLGAGIAAGIGLENKNLLVMLVGGLAAGLLFCGYAGVLRTRWPWLGAGVAALIWAPNLIWQATHGWPQLALASALHQGNSTAGDYLGGLPAQLVYTGLLVIPVVIAGFIRLWRTPELRFLAVTVTLIVIYVLAWIPGKTYYADGMAPVVLAAGSVSAERWIGRARRLWLRRGIVIAAPLVGLALTLPYVLPVLPQNGATVADTVGWPQLTQAVAAQDAALTREGQRPTSIFTGFWAEAGALDVLGSADHLPPVLSGQDAYWMWGPGQASDRTVLVVDALSQVNPYFTSCRVLSTYDAPYQVQNDWTPIQISVCTGPTASWQVLWPHLKYYG
jgi:4-amino-4-deoxy-L-arabinose transferase-like glycosyltransferase